MPWLCQFDRLTDCRGLVRCWGCAVVVVFGMNIAQVDVAFQYRIELRHFGPIARHVQPLLAHVALSRAQIEA